jgi:hypothetical protein
MTTRDVRSKRSARPRVVKLCLHMSAGILLGSLVACAKPPAEPPAATVKPSPPVAKVSAGLVIARMRIDLVLGARSYEKDPQGAAELVRRRLSAQVPRLSELLADKKDAATARDLQPAVDAVATTLALGTGNAPEGEPTKSIGELNALFEAAEETLVGPVRATTPYRASLLAGLLSEAVVRYEDAVGKKKFDTDAYVDAWALRLGAASYYTKITADLRSIDATRATEIARDLQRIESVLPYPEPPDPPEPVDDLTTAVDRVAKALERVAGAVLVIDETGSRATA